MPRSSDEILGDPSGRHSLVLGLTAHLAEREGQPVRHESLQWYCDLEQGAPEIQAALVALRSALGPPPRKASLVQVLGDLVDLGLLKPEVRGFFTTESGTQLVRALEDAGAPSFGTLVSS